MSQQISEQACIQALELAEYKLGHEPTKEEYDELGLVPSSTTIHRVCGSWNDAKAKAGMVENLKNRAKIPEQNQETYTKEECIEAVQLVGEWNPYQDLTQGVYDELRTQKMPSSDTVRRRVGPFPAIREQLL